MVEWFEVPLWLEASLFRPGNCYGMVKRLRCTGNRKIWSSGATLGCFLCTQYLGCSPLTVTVTTRSIVCLVGDPHKPSFATVTGRGPPPININETSIYNISETNGSAASFAGRHCTSQSRRTARPFCNSLAFSLAPSSSKKLGLSLLILQTV